jgi:hypothetical protein
MLMIEIRIDVLVSFFLSCLLAFQDRVSASVVSKLKNGNAMALIVLGVVAALLRGGETYILKWLC